MWHLHSSGNLHKDFHGDHLHKDLLGGSPLQRCAWGEQCDKTGEFLKQQFCFSAAAVCLVLGLCTSHCADSGTSARVRKCRLLALALINIAVIGGRCGFFR